MPCFSWFPLQVAEILLRPLASGTETGAQAGAVQIHLADATHASSQVPAKAVNHFLKDPEMVQQTCCACCAQFDVAFCMQKTSKESIA